MTDREALPRGMAERLGLYRVRAGSSLAELAAVRLEIFKGVGYAGS